MAVGYLVMKQCAVNVTDGPPPRDIARNLRVFALFSVFRNWSKTVGSKILLCLIKDSIKLYSLMTSSRQYLPHRIAPVEQLRDLYERIPFARGRERVALLHRLRRVTTEVRKARAASMAITRAVGAARSLAADTARR